jgi:copper chaperone CopZ
MCTSGLAADLLAVLWSGRALAAGKTVNLFIPSIGCAGCCIIVETMIRQVNGVAHYAVEEVPPVATVTFDEGRGPVDELKRPLPSGACLGSNVSEP